MKAWLVVLGIACLACGYAVGRIDARESLYRRFWREPAATLDDIRQQSRRRHL